MRLNERRRSLWRLYSGARGLMAASVALSVVQAVALLPIALVVREIFDHQVPGGDTAAIVRSGAIIIALYIASVAISLAAQRAALIATARSVAALRTASLEALELAPISWYDAQQTARVHSDLTTESERAERVADPLVAMMRAVVVGLPLTVAAVVVSPLLSTVVLFIAAMIVVVGAARSRPVQHRVVAWQDASRAFSVHVTGILRTVRLVRMRSAGAMELRTGRGLIDDLSRTAVAKAWSQQLAAALHGGVAAVAGTFVLVVGGVAVAQGSLKLGELFAFYAIAVLLLRIASAASGAGAALTETVASLMRILDMLDRIPRHARPPHGGAPADSSLSLRAVSFAHGDHAVLRGLNLHVEPGESVAIVGPNGAGKTTIAELLLGFRLPDEGAVLIGGRSTAELDLEQSRRQIGYVSQEPLLRPGTIAENILYGRPEAGEDELRRAARLAGTDGVAEMLPDGYETAVGEDGVRLSGGQRQRVAVARALVGRPPILILDEPTNHLDEAAVSTLLAGIAALDPPVTLVVITHDAALAQTMDRVLRLEGGRIVAEQTGLPA